MGDNGKLYIPEDEVPEYKSLLREADLILPNQFEAECVLPFQLLIQHALLLKTQINPIAHIERSLKHPFTTSKLSHQQFKSSTQPTVSRT